MKLLNRKNGLTGVAVIVVLGIGIGIVTMATNFDKKMQEAQAEEIVVTDAASTDREKAEITNAQVMTDRKEEKTESTSKTTKELTTTDSTLEGAKIICEATLSDALQKEAPKVAACGVEAIRKNAGIESLSVPYTVNLNHVDYSGLTKDGYWECTVQAGDYTLYEIKVDGKDYSTSDYRSYSRTELDASWGNEKNELINEVGMPAFKKISLNLLSNVNCTISGNGQYSLNLNREYKGYKIQYEVKDDTLYIKEIKVDPSAKENNDTWNADNLVIGIPNDIVLDSILAARKTNGVTMKDIKVKKAEINADNMAVDISRTQIDSLIVDVVNGSINIKDAEVVSSILSTLNGSYYIVGSEMTDCTLEATNGAIDFGKGNTGNIKGKLINGGVNYEEDKDRSACTYDVEVVNGYDGHINFGAWGNYFDGWENDYGDWEDAFNGFDFEW